MIINRSRLVVVHLFLNIELQLLNIFVGDDLEQHFLLLIFLLSESAFVRFFDSRKIVKVIVVLNTPIY